jgi:hypothetical protein
MAALDRDADTVLALIEDGTLPWAFNLSTEIYFRRNVRILAQCIADFQKGKPASNLDFPAVMKLIFPMVSSQPGVVAKLKACVIAQRLNVDPSHVDNLRNCGWLKLIPGSKPHRGRGGSPEIEFASVAAFLKKRRIT